MEVYIKELVRSKSIKNKKLKPFDFVIRVDNMEEAIFIHDNILINFTFKNVKDENKKKFEELTRDLISTFYRRINETNPNNFE